MKILFSAMLSVVLLMSNSFAATITAAQDPWPPFIVKDKNMPGLTVEIVTAAMKTQGYDVDFKLMPWTRAIDEVTKGRIDLLPATWFTQERTNFLVYSQPYLENELTFIKRAGDNFEYTDLDSLSGKNVGVARGYGYGEDFLNASNFRKPESSNLMANLQKLKAKRIDLTLEDKLVAQSIIERSGLNSSDYEFTNNALSINPLYVTSGKANPNSQAYIEAYNKGLVAIKADGTFDLILSKYGIK